MVVVVVSQVCCALCAMVCVLCVVCVMLVKGVVHIRRNHHGARLDGLGGQKHPVIGPGRRYRHRTREPHRGQFTCA